MDNQHDEMDMDQIAIVGLSGRFPGAATVDEFWTNLANGVESVSTFSDDELLAAGVKPEQFNDVNFVRNAAVLDNIEQFDAGLFDFTPGEAQITDPQHRILLECSYEALENAGYVVSDYDGSIGVYAGVLTSSYYLNNLHTQPFVLANYAPLQINIGSDKSFAATKVAYKLGLTGPAMNVDTACSTSLVAVHQACKALLGYECDMALAGGASINVPQKVGHMYHQGGIATPDGHCRTFDADAKGTLRGAGCGVVLLKRLQDALDDGDTVHAVIRGSAVNNDGLDKLGFTAPSIQGQADVISNAQNFADIDAGTIGYVEAHGTGTPVGDPIEVAALTDAFRAHTDQTTYCAIGSLKTNMGHLDMAAGIAGLIKATMALKHQQIPANLHFNKANPQIDFASSPFYVNTELADWRLKGDHPRRAGVSSFGIGGTNAHVILEEAPIAQGDKASTKHHILTLSARTKTSLKKQQQKLAQYLAVNSGVNLADVAYTLQIGRIDYDYRRSIVCSSIEDAIEQLGSDGEIQFSVEGRSNKAPNVIMMFVGQGSSYLDTTTHLYLSESIYGKQIDECAAQLQPHLGFDIRYLLFSDISVFGGKSDGIDPAYIEQGDNTIYAQPALFAIQYSLAKLWQHYGVEPKAMIGHSLGEYVAACLADVFSLADGLKLICARGRLMQSMPAGDMLAIRLPESKVVTLLNDDIALASVNGPQQCVVSGPHQAIAILEQQLKQADHSCKMLKTSHGFHSPMMNAMVAEFKTILQGMTLNVPNRPIVSNVSGDWLSDEQATAPDYWCQHVLGTVRFAAGISTLLADDNCILLEVGPGHQLVNFARRNTESFTHTAIATLQNPVASAQGKTNFFTALSKMWLAHKPLNWSVLYGSQKRTRIPLPTYQYDYERHWVDAPLITDKHSKVVEVPVSNAVQSTSAELVTEDGVVLSVVEQQLVDIWTGLLGIKGINVNHNFFELGGDSLAATQLISRVRQVMGTSLTVQDLYDNPSIMQLSAKLAESSGEVSSSAVIIPLRAKDIPLPLSFSQQRLWFLQKMEPDSVLYNMPEFLKLSGKLNVNALQRSLQGIIDRHESLRTKFIETGDFCEQQVCHDLMVNMDIIDCNDDELPSLLRAAADTPFDLALAPLVRATLFKLSETEHVFFINIHHIVSDGWSMGILVAETMALYSQFVGEQSNELPALPIQYGDFSAWQRQAWETGEREHQLDYWRQHLDGIPDILNLPTDFVRPAVQTYNGKMVLFNVDKATHEGLKDFSLSHNVSMYMTLLSSFNVLLAKYSGQSDIAIGSPMANRQHGDLENLIGFFVNTLVMRNQVSMTDSFLDLLGCVKTNTLAAHANQDVPFEQLVQALQPVREQSHAPLVQVAFILQNAPMEQLQLPDLAVTLGDPLNQHAKYDLLLSLEESAQGIKGQLTYNTDLFAETKITNMVNHLQALFEAILTDAAKPLAQLNMLTEQDEQFLLQQESTDTADFVSIIDMHNQYAVFHPQQIALFEQQGMSYQTVQQKANQLANYLIDEGVKPGDFVAIVQQRTSDFIITMLGILKAGAAYVPLEPDWPSERVEHIVSEANIKVIVTAELMASIYADEAIDQQDPDITIHQDQLAYMIYTSGSTGVPKGVCISHKAIANYIQGVSQRIGFEQGNEYLALSTVAADLGYTAIYGALCYGGTLRIVSHDTALDDMQLAKALKQRPVDVLKIVPSHLSALLADDNSDLLPKKCLIMGGEALDDQLIARIKEMAPDLRIVNHYGPTESSVGVTSFELNTQTRSCIPIGKPFANIKTYILDAHTEQVPMGVPGELYLGGESLAQGYYNDPAKTALNFVPDSFSKQPGARLYKTGDLCQYLPDGEIKYLKRNDSQIKIRGYRVELDDIRNVLIEHEEIDSAVVMHYNDENLGDVLVAWYATTWGDEVDSEELKTFISAQLPLYMVPFAYRCLDSIPLNSNGKVDRKALPDPQLQASKAGTAVLAQTDMEKSLAAIWQELLNVDEVCVETGFAAMGGHSLLAIRLTARIRQQLSLELPLKMIFEMPTIKEQAGYLATIAQLHTDTEQVADTSNREEFSF